MAITPQAIPINFAEGLDTKTDPKQVKAGKFLVLQNQVFDNGGLLQKRNGYGLLTTLPDDTYVYATTYNKNLTAIGPNIAAYSTANETWVPKGSIQPMQVSTLPLIRNSLNQVACDSAIATNGLVCTAYTESTGPTTSYKYVIADSVTGQNIIEPTLIPSLATGTISGSSRVFLIGNYFVIISTTTISSTNYLQYIAIPILNPSYNTPPQNVYSEAYVATSGLSWDAVVFDTFLVVAYNSVAGGQGIHVTALTLPQIIAGSPSSVVEAYTGATDKASLLSVCVDGTNPTTPIYYVSFYDPTNTNSYTLAVSIGVGTIATVFGPTLILSATTLANITSSAQSGLCTVFFECVNSYSYDSSIPTNLIEANTITVAASVGSPYTVVRSIGLGSKSFILNGVLYFLGAFQSTYQPSYFLINGTTSTAANPIVVGKFAYENGGGYLTLGLPNVTIQGTEVSIPYLYKDLIEALSTNNNSQQTTAGGIYSQTGINLGTFDFTSQGIDTAEIGRDLHISGGFLWMYDGYLPVEHNFFLWPDNVEVTTDASAVTPTGTVTSGSAVITAISSMAGIGVGASITGTAIPGGTTIIAVTSTTATMSANATGPHTGTLTITGNIAVAQPYYYQAVYEWSDNQGNIFRSAGSIPVTVTTMGSTSTNTINIPTLRLTYKTSNIVKITLYRWSAANQVYYQITSLTAPLLNSTTVDSVTFVDSVPDSSIIGNEIIYTSGGVVEDINAPATNIMALFDTRLWMLSAEDPNLFYFSKQVIENVPVEMSDLLTYYVAPNTGTEESSGPVTAAFPMDDKLIIFSAEKIVYINGTGPDNTGSNSQYPTTPIFITSTVGCTEQQSIALTPSGLQFQTDKGIWLLDRGSLTVSYVGAPVQAFNNSLVNSAVNVPGTTQIRFTLNTGQTLMYDYYYDQWGTFVGCPAVSSCIYQGLHTYMNSEGQVLQETPGLYLDNTNPVLIGLVSGHIQLTGISGFQRLWEIQLLGEYFSPHLLDIKIGYDFGPLSEQVLIQPTNYTGVYGTDQVYGQTSPYGGPGVLEQWRIQPSQELCQSFQISIQEVFDSSFGTIAGAGFTLSAMTCVIGVLRGYRPVKATNTAGTI